MSSINATNRIENHKIAVRIKVNLLVNEYDQKKKSKSKRSFVSLTKSSSECSMCHRRMRKDIADIQIENKRENAPICVACILGVARKEIPYSPISSFSDETKEKLKKFRQDRRNFKRDEVLP